MLTRPAVDIVALKEHCDHCGSLDNGHYLSLNEFIKDPEKDTICCFQPPGRTFSIVDTYSVRAEVEVNGGTRQVWLYIP